MCMHEVRWREIHRPTQTLKALGKILFWCNGKFWYLHGGWFLIVLKLCLGWTDVSLSAWSPPSVEFMLVDLVDPGSNSSYSFDGELCMPFGWLLVGCFTGNASFLCGTWIVSSLNPSPFTEFHLPPVPDCCCWEMGNFCAGYDCALLHLWDKHIYWYIWVELPFHHIFSSPPFVLNFVPALEGADMDKNHVSHPQGHCLAASVIILLVALHFLPLKKVGLPESSLHAVPQVLDVFAGGRCRYWFWGNSKGDINGKLGLPTIH